MHLMNFYCDKQEDVEMTSTRKNQNVRYLPGVEPGCKLFYLLCPGFLAVVIIVILSVFFNTRLNAQELHECTVAEFLGPLGPGLTYIDGSSPVIACHKNATGTRRVLVYLKGQKSVTGTYRYKHTFIGEGKKGVADSYINGLSAMNVLGFGNNHANAPDPSKPDDDLCREKAIAQADIIEEMVEYVTGDTWGNIASLCGYNKEGEIEIGSVFEGVYTRMTPRNPFEIQMFCAEEGKQVLSDINNWFHGDPDKLEVRDIAYCWHRFNLDSDWAVIQVPKHRILWLTVGECNHGPFIPFYPVDPYVHPDIQNGNYYDLLEDSPYYSMDEIDEIEDLIMAPDGSVNGDIREIQKCIVEKISIDILRKIISNANN